MIQCGCDYKPGDCSAMGTGCAICGNNMAVEEVVIKEAGWRAGKDRRASQNGAEDMA
jgi:hypothetical protein